MAERISADEKASGDALITNVPGLGLAVQTADCIPVLIADFRKMVVAAVHAGRKGVAGGVLPATIVRMRKEYGCDPVDMRAALRPRHFRGLLRGG